MKVNQIYTIINSVTQEILGSTAVVNEDLTNIVDIGKEIFNGESVDNYVKSLVNHIGKVVFNNRTYTGSVPSVFMDAWEFGSVLEKVSADIPVATENSSWSLTNGQSYDTNVFYKPSVSVKFFNDRVTFEVPMSFTEKQIKESFSSAEQLNGFISMLFNAVEKSMTVKLDSLVMRTINNMIAQTVFSDLGAPNATTGYSALTGTKAVNLLKLYNDKFTETLTADEALSDPAFIKFASYTIGIYKDRLSKMSTLFNVGGKERFTSLEDLRIVLLSDFNASTSSYLESDTFHNELVKLPKSETVPYWQGSGTDYSFGNVSQIDVKIETYDVDDKLVKETVKIDGILGIMFDREALGVTNLDRRVTSSYNPKAEFYTNWFKMDAGYFNDLNENFVVFFIDSYTAPVTP